MAHVRTLLRAAAAERLAAAAPAGWSIHPSRDRDVGLDEMPALVLGVRREVAMPDGNCLPDRRDIVLDLTAHVAAAAGAVEDALDEASIWIERAIDADPTFGGIARDCLYRGSEIELVTGGERPAGRITLSFDVRVSAPLDSF